MRKQFVHINISVLILLIGINKATNTIKQGNALTIKYGTNFFDEQ